ncbi:MAG: 3-hydroxyacyl-CoA dehydrogenase family protein [Prevotella sp.]|jgi:3-hydroxybutyryl-CoA dehydrogenase|nr:3-hydroxyacyl-CoA dehydrogenase family protein [Prevotella sp.]
MAEIIESIEEYGLSAEHKKKALFSKIGVVGCGRDGRHIVSLMALSGMEVIFIEVSEERIHAAIKDIENRLDTKIENWGLTESEKRATMARVRGSLRYEDLKNCDFVIECIRYDMDGERSTEMRKEVFRELELVLDPNAIIATNATTVIISELAADLKYKGRCISLHFPVSHTDARLLEVVSGTFTSEEAMRKVFYFANMIKHTAIPVHESSGLVSFRMMITMLNEACQIWMENVASIEDIDKVFTIMFGQRFGIFQLADLLGIEKLVMLMEDMFNEYGDKKYKATPVLWKLFRSKQLGVSSGRGFYIYDESGKIIGPNNLI